MRAWQFTSNFNSGVLDPRLAARVDIKQFYQGVFTGRNVRPLPQGGMEWRPGLKYIDNTASDAEGKLAAFQFNTEQTYLLVFTHLNVAIYRDGVKQADVTTPYSLADLATLYWTQSADTMILCHEDHAPRKLVRGATHSSWTLSTITLSNVPQFDFDDASSPSETDEVQHLVFFGFSASGTYFLELEGQLTDLITWDASDTNNANRIQNELRQLANTSSTGITVTNTAAGEFDVTFGGTDGGKNWQELVGTVESGGTSITASTTTEGSGATEDVWSATRGWPRTVTFYQGRLWFGGSKERPQTLWGSVVADFFNFDVGDGLDSEAVIATLDTDQVNSIRAIFSGQHLQVFTSGGEFYDPNRPVTPGNVSFQRQTRNGARLGIIPVLLDGATMFVDDNGKALREFVFTFVEEAYQSEQLSLLAPHLINQPVQIASQRGTGAEEASYVYLVNTDGSVAVFNTLRSQNVASWAEWDTAGTFESVAVVDETVYFIVKRTINGATVRFIEELSEDHHADASVVASLGGSTTFSGLSHLDGETVRVLADGAVQEDETVASGSITLDREADDVEAGLDWTPELKTMPLNIQLPNGPSASRKKRVIRADVRTYESRGLTLNDKVLPSRSLGADVLDTVPAGQTRWYRVYRPAGWTIDAQLTISGDCLLDATILALAVELEAH